MRRHFTFDCAGEKLAATLDEGSEKVGLLIVSGGNETRAGAFGGQAALAHGIATNGYSVMRFDRRGVGDSEGRNEGYLSADADIAAAIAALRSELPTLECIVAFGNCDAATALALRKGAGCSALILANPWTFEEDTPDNALPEPQAIRSRYLAKLRNPSEWKRLLSGGVDLGKLAKGLKGAAQSSAPASSLSQEIAAGIDAFSGDVQIILAGRDRTAQAFAANWPAEDSRVETLADADHAFSSATASTWLNEAILAVLHEQARQLDMG